MPRKKKQLETNRASELDRSPRPMTHLEIKACRIEPKKSAFASAYYQKLQDPRWQRKRLEVMQRDDFKCCQCEDAKSTLNVHHLYYISKREPWDYPLFALATVCEPCHKNNHAHADQLQSWERATLHIMSAKPKVAKRMAFLMNQLSEKYNLPSTDVLGLIDIILFLHKDSVAHIATDLQDSSYGRDI